MLCRKKAKTLLRLACGFLLLMAHIAWAQEGAKPAGGEAAAAKSVTVGGQKFFYDPYGVGGAAFTSSPEIYFLTTYGGLRFWSPEDTLLSGFGHAEVSLFPDDSEKPFGFRNVALGLRVAPTTKTVFRFGFGKENLYGLSPIGRPALPWDVRTVFWKGQARPGLEASFEIPSFLRVTAIGSVDDDSNTWAGTALGEMTLKTKLGETQLFAGLDVVADLRNESDVPTEVSNKSAHWKLVAKQSVGPFSLRLGAERTKEQNLSGMAYTGTAEWKFNKYLMSSLEGGWKEGQTTAEGVIPDGWFAGPTLTYTPSQVKGLRVIAGYTRASNLTLYGVEAGEGETVPNQVVTLGMLWTFGEPKHEAARASYAQRHPETQIQQVVQTQQDPRMDDALARLEKLEGAKPAVLAPVDLSGVEGRIKALEDRKTTPAAGLESPTGRMTNKTVNAREVNLSFVCAVPFEVDALENSITQLSVDRKWLKAELVRLQELRDAPDDVGVVKPEPMQIARVQIRITDVESCQADLLVAYRERRRLMQLGEATEAEIKRLLAISDAPAVQAAVPLVGEVAPSVPVSAGAPQVAPPPVVPAGAVPLGHGTIRATITVLPDGTFSNETEVQPVKK